jgi:hypothetical protein
MPLKLAIVGKSKDANRLAASYLRKKHNFALLRFDIELRRFMQMHYFAGSQSRLGKVHWERELEFYNAIYSIDPTFFITRIEKLLPLQEKDVVIYDTRYINEAMSLKNLGFTFIRVLPREGFQGNRYTVAGIQENTKSNALIYHEWFSKDLNTYLPADFTILAHQKGQAPKTALDSIIKKLRGSDEIL